MVNRALRRSTLICGRNKELGRSIQLPISRNACLLYPGSTARLITDLPKNERPDQLVILDGTWHQAKTLLRDVPMVGDLPRYQLAPESPGKYRIRLEPTETSLSTVEAVVAALQAIEPDTGGLASLYEAFNAMVESQLAHPNAVYDGPSPQNRKRSKPGIPYAVICDLQNIVIAYGESVGCERKNSTRKAGLKRMPVFWVAQRMVSNELYQCPIRYPNQIPTSTVFDHLQLSKCHFEIAVCVEEFRKSWQAFLRPHDVLAVYHHGTIKMLENINVPVGPNLVLKSVKLERESIDGALENVLQANHLAIQSNEFPGRAGRRLAGLYAFVQHLHDIGQTHLESPAA